MKIKVTLDVRPDLVDRRAANGLTEAGYNALATALRGAGFELMYGPTVIVLAATAADLRAQAAELLAEAEAVERGTYTPRRCLAAREWQPPIVHRSNSDLLDELRSAVNELPGWRLHVHPDSAMWISISVHNTGLSPSVHVVPDPACEDAGLGWIESLTAAQWRHLRALVGKPVSVQTATLGTLTGTLIALDRKEAQLDLGGGDIRYLPWISINAATVGAVDEGTPSTS